MDKHDYAKTLLRFRGQQLPLLKFLGARWIIMKIILGGFGTAAIFCPHVTIKGGGVFLVGYVLGVAVADIRGYFLGKRKWDIQQELYDWNKIESLAKDKEINA